MQLEADLAVVISATWSRPSHGHKCNLKQTQPWRLVQPGADLGTNGAEFDSELYPFFRILISVIQYEREFFLKNVFNFVGIALTGTVA